MGRGALEFLSVLSAPKCFTVALNHSKAISIDDIFFAYCLDSPRFHLTWLNPIYEGTEDISLPSF